MAEVNNSVCNIHGSEPTDGWYKDGTCRSCKLEYNRKNAEIINRKSKAYRLKNSEKLKIKAREKYKENSEEIKKYRKEYRAKNKTIISIKDKARSKRSSETRRIRYKNEKLKAFEHYSSGHPKCSLCGITEFNKLNIDHIDGGGQRHVKSIRSKCGSLYRWLMVNKFPPGFRVLCWNCNVKQYFLESTSRFSTWKNKLKIEVFSYYSNGEVPHCKQCKETEIRVLTIDHVNGGGKAHRRSLKISGGGRFYAWLRRNSYPDDYQVLCFNCNSSKSL